MPFWDSSALVPLCTKEPRSTQTGKLWKRFAKNAASWTATVEISSALARLLRENRISNDQWLKAETRLSNIEFSLVVIQPGVRMMELARTFPSKYGLRAPDSIQLDAALIWCKEYPRNQDFVSGDDKLLEVAKTIGFTVHRV